MTNVCFQNFDTRSSYFKIPFGAVKEETAVNFKLKLRRNRPAKNVRLIIGCEDGDKVSVDMTWVGMELAAETYECTFVPSTPGLFLYHFEMDGLNSSYYVYESENGKGYETIEKGNEFQLTVYNKDYKTPDWFKGGIMYQIFPDRFCRVGDFPKDTTGKRTYLKEWGKEQDGFAEGGYPCNDFYGGNFKGIESKLSYLKSLGVTAIYLNPIFFAAAYHRYNTNDFTKIDPLLGTEDDFRELCKKAKEMGIGIILDGVFSHTGTDSIYFNQSKIYDEPGAYNSRDSKYYKWYDFESWPDKYRCWWGIKDLPQINNSDPDYLEFIAGEKGVVAKWLRDGASGFRLDVADELSEELIEKIRKVLKKEDKDNILIGEVWEDASNKISYGKRRSYLDGKQLDSVMNYPWRAPIINFIKTGNCEELSNVVLSILDHYPKETVDCLFNLLSTHDTVRLITCLAGENPVDKSIEWKQKTCIPQEKLAAAIELVKFATAILYFLPGVPCVYYGDEAGFQGYEDPFNRRCFMWGEENKELLSWFKTLGDLRKNLKVLKKGTYNEIAAHDGLFAFEREDNGEKVIFAINLGESEQSVETSGRVRLRLGNVKQDYFTLKLMPKSLVVVSE